MNNQHHHTGHTKISTKLPIIGVAAILIIIIGIVGMTEPKIKYTISTEEILNIVNEREDVMRPPEFMHAYYTKDSLYRFIDLRSAHDYLKGHLDGAVNIPIHKILDDEYQDIFNQNDKINILYFSDQCGACGPWMILRQIGYTNIKILQGGYGFVKTSIIDKYEPMSGDYSAEKPKYDYATVIKNTPSSGADTDLGGGPVIVVKKKKGGNVLGGC